MALYLGRTWKRGELLSMVGDPAQLAGVRQAVLEGGKAEGVRALEIYTGSGFRFTVLPGRGMDIPYAFYRGAALSFATATGITSPAYYEEPGLRWLRSFFGGLLTTCGITACGAPGKDGEESYGLHGRIANAAAEDLSVQQEWDGDEYRISVRGRMREAAAMGENMTLTRTLNTVLGGRGFDLHDVVENRGFEPQPLMLLYHFNFGFPLLGPNTRVVAPILSTTARDEESEKENGVAESCAFPSPISGYREKVYFHRLAGKERTFVGLVNRDIGNGEALGISLRYDRSALPHLTEWKMPCRGFYVVGLEPGTVTPMGRGFLRQRGELPFLEPQTTYSVHIRFDVVDTREEIDGLEREAESLI